MAEEKIKLLELLSACIDVGIKAGNLIKEVKKSGKVEIDYKGKNDPVTNADVQAQKLINSSLIFKWKNLCIIGEETCELINIDSPPNFHALDHLANQVPHDLYEVELKDVVLFVDPLDGTKEFIKGELEAVTTLIGIAYKGEPIAGVVYQPYGKSSSQGSEGMCIYGMKGIGVHGVEVGAERGKRSPSNIVLVTTSSHYTPIVEKAVSLINPAKVIRAGGAGNKVLLLIKGIGDIYVYPSEGTKKWDTCAPESLIRILGGKLTDLNGNEYKYFQNTEKMNSGGIVCSLKDHQHYIEKLKPISRL